MDNASGFLPNITFFIQLGLFFTCYFFLNKFIFGPYLNLLERRRFKTVGLKERAEKELEKAQALELQTKSYLVEERKRLNHYFEEERKLIEENEKLMLQKARKESLEQLNLQQKELEIEGSKALSSLQQEVPYYSAQIVEKLTGRKPSLTELKAIELEQGQELSV